MADSLRSTALGERGSLAIAAFRIFFGLVFLANGAAKLVPGAWNTPWGFLIGNEGARDILATEVARHPLRPYRDVMEGVVLANWDAFGPALGLLEMGLGLLLVVGLATTAAAVLGAAFALHLHFLTLFGGRWLFEYPMLWAPLLILAMLGAGRFYGLDGRLSNRKDELLRRRASASSGPHDGG